MNYSHVDKAFADSHRSLLFSASVIHPAYPKAPRRPPTKKKAIVMWYREAQGAARRMLEVGSISYITYPLCRSVVSNHP